MFSRKLILIANLSARNHSNHENDFQIYLDFFLQNHIHTELHISRSIAELRAIIQDAILNGFTEFITIGGDGSLNYLVNELMNYDQVSQFKIGVIPLGTGNDYIKNFDFKSNQEILESILKGNSKPIDLGKIEFQNQAPRYFINLAGLGFNGHVIQNIDRFKIFGGLAYYFALVYSFFGYRAKSLSLKSNNKTISDEVFLISIGLGKYAGGNMKLCPEAILDDGLFDVNIIPKVGFFQLIKNLSKLSDGSYLSAIDCQSFRTQLLEIISNDGLHCEADGEYLGSEIKSIEIIKNGINFYSTS